MTPAQYHKYKEKQAEKYQFMKEREKEHYRKLAAARVFASRAGLTINKLSKQEKYFVINPADNFTKYFGNIDDAIKWIKDFKETQDF